MQIPVGSDLYGELPRPYRNVRWLSVYCETETDRLRAVLPAPLQSLNPQRRTTLFEVFIAHYGAQHVPLDTPIGLSTASLLFAHATKHHLGTVKRPPDRGEAMSGG